MHNIFALDGADGSGKSSVAKAAIGILARRSIPAVYIAEPGSTPLGTELRSILLHKKEIPICPEAMTLIFSAATVQAFRDARRMRDDGAIVIFDRCYLSNLAYRHADGMSFADSVAPYKQFNCVIPPSQVFLIAVHRDERRRRLTAVGRGIDRFESRDVDYQEKVSEGYQMILDQRLAVRVDGCRPIDDVAQDIVDRILSTTHDNK